MDIDLEQLILRNIISNEAYTRKVLPFIQPSYFEGTSRKVFLSMAKYISKYNGIPSKDALKVMIDEDTSYSDEEYEQAINMLPNVYKKDNSDEKWLLEVTEKWCQDRAVYNAVMESINIIDGKHKSLTKNALPDILQKALAVSFDRNIGHDYIENFKERFDFYHEEMERLPFDLEYMNKITKGGLVNKSLMVLLAGCVHPDTKIKVRISS